MLHEFDDSHTCFFYLQVTLEEGEGSEECEGEGDGGM